MPRPRCRGLQGTGEMRLSALIATVPSWTTRQDVDSKAVQKKTRNKKEGGHRQYKLQDDNDTTACWPQTQNTKQENHFN
ncbi:hypothetical protein Q5P01_009240 [Channa striata]|uniref:Uncharacterized protein n=1 Tax=Channa striata TaxID=64152 RepID=A0AA88SSE1_CHASR|nr:hypothetical protein Q5P01_009240 [Channa striata]